MKILVTGAGALLGQGIVRSLRMSRLAPEIVAVDPSPLSAGLYWADARYVVPMASNDRYIDAIETILDTELPDALLVGTDVELKLFATHRTRLEKCWPLKVIVSSPSMVQIADDKFLTYQFLKESGFNPPESRLVDSAQELVEQFDFPLVVKPRNGARSAGVIVVKTKEELAQAMKGVQDAVVQEHLSEEFGEFTAGTVTFDGNCQALIVMRRDLRDGNTYRAFTVQDSEIDAQVRAMAQAFGAYGPANFQFRVENGIVRVFEINCRFSGTTPLRALAGFNEVDLVLRHTLLDDPVKQPSIDDVVLLRHWEETVIKPKDLIR